jgi:hypothetical protein
VKVWNDRRQRAADSGAELVVSDDVVGGEENSHRSSRPKHTVASFFPSVCSASTIASSVPDSAVCESYRVRTPCRAGHERADAAKEGASRTVMFCRRSIWTKPKIADPSRSSHAP